MPRSPTTAERTKRCNGCQLVKPWSEFYAKVKWPDGTMRQPHSRCKKCRNEHNRTHPEAQLRYGRKRYQRIRQDPEAWAARLAEVRASYARLSADPEWYATRLDQIRESKRRRNGVTPDRYRGVYRRPEHGAVDTTPVREAVEASGLSYGEIAARIGITEAAVRRAMQRDTIGSARACRILDALGLAPVEVGF